MHASPVSTTAKLTLVSSFPQFMLMTSYLHITHPLQENELFKAQMKGVWKISDLGGVKFCVGIAIAQDRENHTISLSQTALIDRIITQFRQQDTYPNKTPMDPGLKLRCPMPSDILPEDQIELMKLPYCSLVSCLLYVSICCIVSRHHIHHTTTITILRLLLIHPLECCNPCCAISQGDQRAQAYPQWPEPS